MTMIPKFLTSFSWFDPDSEDIIVSVTDKTTMTFTLEEFSEIYKIFIDTRDELLKLPEIKIGTYNKNGEEYEELIFIPDSGDYN
jgi:hypothetical protein